MDMILLLDSVDYSGCLTKRGYTVNYKDVLGANSCYTLDGTFHEDVLARKAIVTAPLKPLTSAQIAALIDACHDCTNATYFDTKANAAVTRAAKASLSAASIVLNKSTALYWANSGRQGITLTIEEK